MTNQEAKHKAIQEAYGEYYNQLEPYIDQYGWITETDGSIHCGLNEKAKKVSKIINQSQIDFACVDGYLIPQSIINIDSNNGWVRIEQDRSNLPNKSGVYTWMNKNGRTETFDYYTKEDCDDIVFDYRRKALMSSYYTHYRPVQEIPNPIY